MIITVDIDGVPLCDLGGLGFEVTRIYDGKVDLWLPDGWMVKRDSEHTTKIIDSNGDWRATHVETIRNGERLHLLTRYSVHENCNGDDCDIVIFDRGKEIETIYSGNLDLSSGDWISFVKINNVVVPKYEFIAKYFADKPDWRNPLAYWGG